MNDGLSAPMEFKVDGMSCGHCTATVEKAIGEVAGVKSCDVNLDKGLASVLFEAAAKVAPKSVIEAIEAAGYEARMMG